MGWLFASQPDKQAPQRICDRFSSRKPHGQARIAPQDGADRMTEIRNEKGPAIAAGQVESA